MENTQRAFLALSLYSGSRKHVSYCCEGRGAMEKFHLEEKRALSTDTYITRMSVCLLRGKLLIFHKLVTKFQ